MTPVNIDSQLPALDPTRLVRPRDDARFASLLKQRAGASPTPATVSDDRSASAREAAQDLVSTTFVTPVLAAMREDPFRSELFHGGQAEEMFGSRMDQILADRITRAARFPLADAVYRQLTGAPATVNTHG